LAAGGRIFEQFTETGYAGPARVLSRDECARFLREVELRPRLPLDWDKGTAITSRAYYEIASRAEILDVVAELLGGDVLLWGASIVTRPPGAVHSWHSDIESSDPDGRTVSVWIGLKNTTPDSSLLVLPYSHLFGATVQQVRQEHGKGYKETTVEDLEAWARERDERSKLVTVGVTDGEAVFFDGRLWHGTHNLSRRTRRALLLQYAAPDTAIRIPDLNRLDWPFRQLDLPRPPCLIVRGSAQGDRNRVVPAPLDGRVGGDVQLTSRIYPLRLPLEPDEKAGWKPYPAFIKGSTANLPGLSFHASVLLRDHSPHPPSAHTDEEILLLLAGEIELVFSETERARLRPRELAYIPGGVAHTQRTTSAEPATYVILKWRGEETGADRQLARGRFDTSGAPRVLFEGPTRFLRKLHAHVTVLEPGDGYEPHADAYDVAVVVLEGEVETLGGRAAPNDVVFWLAGEEHGMRNVGEVPARYVVFEFHGHTSLVPNAPHAASAMLAKIRDPRRLRRKLKKLLRR
jgi:quercetin dioxygenase-like cupin family protein